MNYYFHKEILKDTKIPMGILVVGLIIIYLNGFEWEIGFFILFALVTLFLVLRKVWKHRNEKEYYKNLFDKPVYIEGSSIVFPSGYYFKFSNLHLATRLESFEISECCINTQPISFVVNENEIIFVPKISEEDIRNFCKADKIPISERLDIWERINWPFLDTEFEENEIETNETILNSLGIEKKELIEIRKTISSTMSMNYFAWEWNYLGQFDYLTWTKLNKEKYWWSMDIALRNYKKNYA